MKQFLFLLVFGFILSSFSSNPHIRHSKTTVKLVQKTFFVGDSIMLKLNGEFSTDGDCSASLIWDVAKQIEFDKWDTLTHNLLGGQLCCGLPTVRIKKSVMPFGVAVSERSYSFENNFEFLPGKYMFLFADRTGKMVSSKPFEVREK